MNDVPFSCTVLLYVLGYVVLGMYYDVVYINVIFMLQGPVLSGLAKHRF